MTRISLKVAYKNLLSFIGLAIIVLSIFLINEHLPYPSYWALLPCIGTFLILMFATERTFAHAILCWPPFVVVGLISYSAYLWHQPLFAFARILSLTPPGPWLMGALSVATLILAYASWRFVEQPFRNRTLISQRQVFAFTAATSGVLILVGLSVFRLSGMPERVAGLGLTRGSYIAYNESAFTYKKVSFVDPEKLDLLVLGNSTGRDLVNVIKESGRFNDFEIVYRDDVSLCADRPLTELGLSLVSEADAVVVATDWTYHGNCTKIDIETGPVANKPFVMVGPKHFGFNLDAYMHLSPEGRIAARAALLPDTIWSNDLYSRTVPSDNYVDLLSMMADLYGGVPVFDAAGKMLSVDRVHLTKPGAMLFAGFVFDDPAWRPVLDFEHRVSSSEVTP